MCEPAKRDIDLWSAGLAKSVDLRSAGSVACVPKRVVCTVSPFGASV